MKFDNLACTEKDGILHVKLNRPEKRNAISPMVFWDIERCFSEAAMQPSIQVILLSGEGKGFSAGTDLTAFQPGGNAVDVRRFVRMAQRAYNEVELAEKAVIALIHGFCLGIGCLVLYGLLILVLLVVPGKTHFDLLKVGINTIHHDLADRSPVPILLAVFNRHLFVENQGR